MLANLAAQEGAVVAISLSVDEHPLPLAGLHAAIQAEAPVDNMPHAVLRGWVVFADWQDADEPASRGITAYTNSPPWEVEGLVGHAMTHEIYTTTWANLVDGDDEE